MQLLTPILTVSFLLATAQGAPVAPASFNVRDFGAKGDGIADDTAACNAAAALSGLVLSRNRFPSDGGPGKFRIPRGASHFATLEGNIGLRMSE